MEKTEEQQNIIDNGKYLKTSYGISPVFEWRLFSYKGKRYNVSMFSNEIEEIKRDYCNLCGRATYNIKIYLGQYICPACLKEYK